MIRGPDPKRPLIVNSDRTILLETKSEAFEEARDAISSFLELVKSPELFYTYSMDELSLWNGFSSGLTASHMLEVLESHAKFPVPSAVKQFIAEQAERYGLVRLEAFSAQSLSVESDDPELVPALLRTKEIGQMVHWQASASRMLLPRAMRGAFKLEMIKLGFPVDDRAGFEDGDVLDVRLRPVPGFAVRPYQEKALDAFFGGASRKEGAGVVVLPCGAGKTLVGVLAMIRLGMKTLVVAPNIVALRQWKSEILARTELSEKDVGEYSGEIKDIKPVTLATYQVLIWREAHDGPFRHLSLFSAQNWGLIIYDEIHLLPAPVFRAITGIQARRRLGLTATLVREDGRERDVFALIGPKKFDLPWKELEKGEFLAKAMCLEIRVPLDATLMAQYLGKSEKSQSRLAAENPGKLEVVAHLMERMKGHRVLIIGQYLDQLNLLSQRFRLPLLTGSTPTEARMKLYQDFREGKIDVLVVSKVANFAIDLPDADVAIQISGTYGSRQEEAQRLGRVLRPKAGDNRAWFFSLVSADTREETYAQNRKRFLLEQGYVYRVLKASEVAREDFEKTPAVAP